MENTSNVINIGDTVEIVSQGWHVIGIVRSANNYGTPANPDWYIEMDAWDGPHYWKQSIDGGYVVTSKIPLTS